MIDVATMFNETVLNETLLNDLSGPWARAMGNATLYGGAALAIAWAAARTRRLPGRWQCWLWRLALVKLLLAAIWLRPVELPWLPSQVPVSSETSHRIEGIHLTAAAENAALGRTSQVAPTSRSIHSTITPASWLMHFWCIGVVCMAGQLFARQRRVRGLVRNSTRVIHRRAYDRLRESCRAMRVPRKPDVRMSARIAGPCLVGVLQPTILLPAAWDSWGDRELGVALLHEVAHLKRRDLAWNWLPVIAETFFYFHPLVWIAKRNWAFTQEVATDEMALACSRLTFAEYGNGLIEIVSKCGDAPALLAASLGSSHRQLTKRLLALRHTRPARSSWPLGMAIIAAGVLAIVPWKLTGREPANESHKPVQIQPPAVESEPVDNAEREQAADRLKSKGGNVRFFRDAGHPDHWVQIILEGNAFGDDDMLAVSQLATWSPTDLHLRETQVTARGLRMLLGDRIRSLALSGESTDDRSMQELPFFAELKTLQIGQTSITDAGVQALAGCRSIETLRLNSDGLNADALQHLSGLPALRTLGLGDAFGDSAAAHVNRLAHLDALELSAEITDAFLSELDRLPKLASLTLSGPNVTDASIRLLTESAPFLKTLYLRHADLTEQGIRWISELSDLEILALDETEVGDDAIEHLASLEKLRWLDLSGADAVTDKSLETIGKLRNMRQLFLMKTQVTTEGLENLRGLEDLRHLDLQSTKVRSIPPWLKARPMLYISLD